MELKIKSTKGYKFVKDNVLMECLGGLGLFSPSKGFVSFDTDKYGIKIPYTPLGGRKALKEIINDLNKKIDTLEFAKPINL